MPSARIKDPTLFLYVFLDRHLARVLAPQPCHDLTEAIANIVDRLGLSRVDGGLCAEPRDLDFEAISRLSYDFQVILNRSLEDVGDPHPRQLLLYAYTDVLVLQVTVGLRGEYDCQAAWAQLSPQVSDFRKLFLQPALAEVIWGDSLVYWMLHSKQAASRPLLEACHEALTGDGQGETPTAALTIGLLGLAEPPTGSPIYLLLTPDESALEDAANSSLFFRSFSEPPDFSILQAWRNKFLWQHDQYQHVKSEVERQGHSIDRLLNWLIDVEQRYGRRLEVVNSPEANEVLAKLSYSARTYADYRRAITRVRELQTTLVINYENYCRRRLDLVAAQTEDRLLLPVVEQMERTQTQLTHDARYFDALLERAETVLASTHSWLTLLSSHQERDVAYLQGFQTSTLTALLVGLTLLQLFTATNTFVEQPWFLGNVALAVITGTFGLAQILINWRRTNTEVDRWAIATFVALLASSPLTWSWGTGAPAAVEVLEALLPFALGFLAGYGGFRLIEEWNLPPAPEAEPTDRNRQAALQLLRDLPQATSHELVSGRSSGDGEGEIPLLRVFYVVPAWRVRRTVQLLSVFAPLRDVETVRRSSYRGVRIEPEQSWIREDDGWNGEVEIWVHSGIQHWLWRRREGGGGLWGAVVGALLSVAGLMEFVLFRPGPPPQSTR